MQRQSAKDKGDRGVGFSGIKVSYLMIPGYFEASRCVPSAGHGEIGRIGEQEATTGTNTSSCYCTLL